MRGVAGCVLLLCLALCSADQIERYQEGSDFDGFQQADLTLGAVSGEDAGFFALLQQPDLVDDAESTQQSFGVWPTTTLFLDTNFQSWVDRQLTVLDSLRGVLVSGCPHAAAVATPPQSDYPSLLSYMASSRFGPATLTAYARQVDQDLQPAGFSISLSSNDEDMDNVLDDSEPLLDGWPTEDEPEDVLVDMQLEDGMFGAGVRPRALDVNALFGSQQDADAQTSAAAGGDSLRAQQLFQSAAWDPNSLRVDIVETAQEVSAWGDACNFILFVALCIGCIFVWIGLIRAWISCCRLEDQAKIRKEAAQQSASNPLLAPLIPEGIITKNPVYTSVEVAAEHPPQGSFMATQGPEFTTIAYMPLPGSKMGMQK